MPTTSLPIVKSLNEIYTSSALLEQGVRWNSLQEAFKVEYGTSAAQRIARAPGQFISGSRIALIRARWGVVEKERISDLARFCAVAGRVNIIGEHIDYCGL